MAVISKLFTVKYMALTKVLHMREVKETKFGGRREIDHISRRNFAALDESAIFKSLLFSNSICSEIERACLAYNLNVPIKAKDPPWFAVQMGSVADSVVAKIRIIIDNTIFSARKITQKWNPLTYLYLIMLNQTLKSYFSCQIKLFSR